MLYVFFYYFPHSLSTCLSALSPLSLSSDITEIDKDDLELRDLTDPKDVQVLIKYVQDLKTELKHQKNLNKKLRLDVETIQEATGRKVRQHGAPKIRDSYKAEMTHYLQDHFLDHPDQEGEAVNVHDETKADVQYRTNSQRPPQPQQQQGSWNWW